MYDTFNLCTYTIMELIQFIIMATIIVILSGCFFLAHTNTIVNYISSTLTDYNKYIVQIIDNNDANYIKWIIPRIQFLDNLELESQKKISPNKGINNNPVAINSDLQYKCPNMTIPDNQLFSEINKHRNHGIELPWDKEIGFCEVLKGTDRDMYANVQDSTNITFY
jgi:hypothetical protein